MQTHLVSNSYWRGQDLVIQDGDRRATLNVKDGMPAVDVRDNSHHYTSADSSVRTMIDRLGEDRANAIYEGVAYEFWNHAVQDLAREHEFETVYSAGRSSGWAAVDGTGFLDLVSLDSDETDDGSEEDDDVSDAFRERERFFKFALAARELADDYAGYQYESALRAYIEDDDREAAERRECEYRDIETIG